MTVTKQASMPSLSPDSRQRPGGGGSFTTAGGVPLRNAPRSVAATLPG